MNMDEEKFYKDRLLKNKNYTVFLPDTTHIIRTPITTEGYNTQKLLPFIKEQYPSIYDSIENENYYISDYETFFYLYEITNEKEEMIGFAAFTVKDEKSIILNQIYVIPEERGNKHFVKVYNYFSQLLPEAEILVKNPNRTIINNIKQLDYCRIINERFMISFINFITDQVSYADSLTYTNKTYADAGKTVQYNTESNLYDLKLDAVIKFTTNNKVYTGKEDLLLVERSTISMPRYEDELKYHILEKRRSDDWILKNNYFKKVKKTLKKHNITINN